MQRLFLFLAVVSFAVCATAGTPAAGSAADESGYVCPMLEHTQVFDHPGTCPLCGMTLVARAEVAQRRVAIFVFDGVEVIDYAAPYEVLGQAGFQVFTVGATRDPVTAAMGQRLVPSYSFDDAPPAGVLVLPGGDVNTKDSRAIDWIRARTETAGVVLSVCNGAFWLAKAGLLDGLTATTFHQLIDALQKEAPKCRVVRDRRFVDNGKIVTSAGLTSGMDGALHVVDKLLGRDKAREVALHLEYDWNPESSYARASMADRYYPDLDLGPGVRFTRTHSLGDRGHWRLEGVLKTSESRDALLARIADQLAEQAHWTRVGGEGGVQTWSFPGARERTWRAELEIEPGNEAGAYDVSFRLDRQP